jgi:hypothetical protein
MMIKSVITFLAVTFLFAAIPVIAEVGHFTTEMSTADDRSVALYPYFLKPFPWQSIDPRMLQGVEIIEKIGDGYLVVTGRVFAEYLSASGINVTRVFDTPEEFLSRSGLTEAVSDGSDEMPPLSGEFNPFIDAIMSRVNETWARDIIQRLQDFQTRYSYTDSCRAAEEYVHGLFGDFGLDAELFTYSHYGNEWRDVIGTLQGSATPDQIFIICGHLDSITYDDPYHWAPGADDNGSGSAAVLIAAELLSNYEFDSTIKFICFTGEEQGLYGSYYWVRDAYNRGLDIRGVVNLDMIAYRDTQAMDVNIYCDNNSISKAHADMMIENGDLYGGVAGYRIVDPGAAYSDHYYFWYYDYPAVMGIERETHQWNPYYHSPNDIVDNCHMDLQVGITRMSVATLIQLASPDTANLVNIHIVPENIDYSPGETLCYTGNLVNYRYQQYSGDVWADLYLPNSKPYPGNPVMSPVHVTLGGYTSRTGRTFSHVIPGNPPRGTYRYVARTGEHPDTVVDESEFEFTIY